MTTRDRTPLFLRYREESRSLHRRAPHLTEPSKPKPHPDHQLVSLSDDEQSESATRITRARMEPDWVFAYNDLKGDLAEVQSSLNTLAAMYSKHLLPSFGESDTSQLEHDIRTRSHALTQMLHSVERKVRNVGNATQPHISPDADTIRRDQELEIRRNIQRRFATPLQELSLSFRKKQKDYYDKLSEMRETYAHTNNSSVMESSMHHDGEPTLEDSEFSETQLLTVENASALAHERTQELNRVAASINDLAGLVKDIASLVVDQGTVLDRVDYNLEEVKTKTFGAVRELRIADRYQRKRHALCCIIILAVACGVMFIILMYKWTS